MVEVPDRAAGAAGGLAASEGPAAAAALVAEDAKCQQPDRQGGLLELQFIKEQLRSVRDKWPSLTVGLLTRSADEFEIYLSGISV